MQKIYQTRDFYEAAFLILKGQKLTNQYRSNGNTVFVFSEGKEILDYVKEYFSMSSCVEPVAYTGIIRNLKSIIHFNRISTSSSEESNNVSGNSKGKRS